MADETDANPLVQELVADTATDLPPLHTVTLLPPLDATEMFKPLTLDEVSAQCALLINTLPPDQRQLVVKVIRSEFGG